MGFGKSTVDNEWYQSAMVMTVDAIQKKKMKKLLIGFEFPAFVMIITIVDIIETQVRVVRIVYNECTAKIGRRLWSILRMPSETSVGTYRRPSQY